MVELADGTITWMVGPQTLIELTVPTVRAAAAATGRPEAEVVVCAPACLTVDPDGARAAAQQVLGWYDGMPTYWAMIEREELSGAAELALVGDEASIRRQIDSYADAGATTFAIQPFGTPPEREATRRLVWTLASQAH